MLFHSLAFAIFFPTVVAIYFAMPQRFRWVVLLVASYIFYGFWRPEYLLLIAASTVVDYACARKLAVAKPRAKNAWLALSLVTNLGLLGTFKYLGFFARSIAELLAPTPLPFAVESLDFLLPVGISFYTFQTLSYTIDVYRGSREPEMHLGRFALYVSFFPQLVAGPIERSVRLLPQFGIEHRWDFDRSASGLSLMLWGFFKKLVIADRAGFFVDAIYSQPGEYQGTTVVIATYLFAFQIYCDFSGYSDIAIGAARVLGFELMTNFDRPYWSADISTFWRRWHISLSTWFRDYVYLPLGGNRAAFGRVAMNLAAVFLLSGLWHGANWTFVAWGAFHGAWLIAALGFRKMLARRSSAATQRPGIFRRVVTTLVTFHGVCLGWVLFRADSIGHAFDLLLRLPISYQTSCWHELTHITPDRTFGGVWATVADPSAALAVDLGIIFGSVIVLELVDYLRHRSTQLPAFARWLGWSALTVWVLLTAVQTHTPFLYFQF